MEGLLSGRRKTGDMVSGATVINVLGKRSIFAAKLKPGPRIGDCTADQREAGPMKSRLLLENAGERTFILVLDRNEEAFAAISAFAAGAGLTGAAVSAIGAFAHATVGWFDFGAMDYRPIHVDQQCEAVSVLGDIAEGDDGKSSLHLHAVLGLSDGTVRGGHLLSGLVNPTLEVTITERPTHLRRRKRPDLGLALIDPL